MGGHHVDDQEAVGPLEGDNLQLPASFVGPDPAERCLVRLRAVVMVAGVMAIT